MTQDGRRERGLTVCVAGAEVCGMVAEGRECMMMSGQVVVGTSLFFG